mgnify:CR=1 FL=1
MAGILSKGIKLGYATSAGTGGTITYTDIPNL